MKKRLAELVEEIEGFVGESPQNAVRNVLLVFVIFLYYILGILILVFPNSKLLTFMWEKREMQIFVACVLIGFASYAVAFFVLPYFKNLKNIRGILFRAICLAIMLPFHLVGKLVSYILIISRQKNIAIYLAEYMIATVVALIAVSLSCNIMMTLQNIWGIVLGDRLIAFLLVVISILVFFFSGEKIVYLSLKIENVKKLSGEEFDKKWYEIKKEIQYTNIYFYIISNIILLCAPVEEGGFGELFVNAFFGVTTLAALVREVHGNIEKDEKNVSRDGKEDI